MGEEGGQRGTLPDDLTTAEREALHEVEVGIEWLRRAEGNLIAFHHAVGHGVDHLAVAERRLRETGHDDLADRVRDDLLPRGVTADDRWSYALVEEYQHSFLAEMAAFEAAVRADLAGGERHVAERHQQRAWRERARGERFQPDADGEGDSEE